MLEYGVLFLAGVMFLGCLAALLLMLKEFSELKVKSILMESTFREHQEYVVHIQKMISSEVEGAEENYNKIIEDYNTVREMYNGVQSRINYLEQSQNKPMAPDVTLN